MPINETDTVFYLLIGVIAAIFLIAILIGLVQFFNNFSQKLRYLNIEIGRTSGAERRRWIRRRRRLWLSLIPFIKY